MYKPMIIQFVCIGNTYRSRLAEAYFNVLRVPGWQAVSSGVRASRNLNGPITIYALEILCEQKWDTVAKKEWNQTTKSGLAESDVVVFMHKECFDACVSDLDFTPKNYKVWGIADMEADSHDELAFIQAMHIARDTFVRICARVDELVVELARGESRPRQNKKS